MSLQTGNGYHYETSFNHRQTLQVSYVQGLSEDIKDELAAQGPPKILEALYNLAIRLDNRLQEQRLERQANRATPHEWAYMQESLSIPGSPKQQEAPPEPMQLGAAGLKKQEVHAQSVPHEHEVWGLPREAWVGPECSSSHFWSFIISHPLLER